MDTGKTMRTGRAVTALLLSGVVLLGVMCVASWMQSASGAAENRHDAREAADMAILSFRNDLAARRRNIPVFLDEIVSWNARLRTAANTFGSLAGMTEEERNGGESANARLAREMFERIVLSPEQLEEMMRGALRMYLERLSVVFPASHVSMPVHMATPAGMDMPFLKDVFGEGLAVCVLSEAGGVALYRTASRLLSGAKLVLAGAGGAAVKGTAGGIVGGLPGAAIGLAAGIAVDWYMTNGFQDSVRRDIEAHLDQLEQSAINDPEGGLAALFSRMYAEAALTHASAY